MSKNTGKSAEIHFDYDAEKESKFVKANLSHVGKKEMKSLLKAEGQPQQETRKRTAKMALGDVLGLDDEDDEEEEEEERDAPSSSAAVPVVEETPKPPPPAEPQNHEAAVSVFVANLPEECCESDLSQLFSQFGTVVGTSILRTPSGKTKRKGFVEFQSTDGLQAALLAAKTDSPLCKGIVLGGNTLHVEQKTGTAKPLQRKAKRAKLEGDSPTTEEGLSVSAVVTEKDTVFIRNLFPSTPEKVFKKFFESCGEIIDFRLMPHKRCALVQFKSINCAKKAIAKSGETLMGQKLEIQFDKNPQGMKRIMDETVRTLQKKLTEPETAPEQGNGDSEKQTTPTTSTPIETVTTGQPEAATVEPPKPEATPDPPKKPAASSLAFMPRSVKRK
eukprot:TRINITY_DN66418_c12_g1_i1.p1 TRINITY_DN66418_c12_g1~~TRINITY_DN66418_c12_g1_i1.p1  ORF type:complete len:405 (-),score=35.62 TRINITY_DN66418_c12_g1_i1:163-1326(-)